MEVKFKVVSETKENRFIAKSLSDTFFKGKEYYIVESQENGLYNIYSVELVKKACEIGCGSEPAISYFGVLKERDKQIVTFTL